jgi:hypothetical protein
MSAAGNSIVSPLLDICRAQTRPKLDASSRGNITVPPPELRDREHGPHARIGSCAFARTGSEGAPDDRYSALRCLFGGDIQGKLS